MNCPICESETQRIFPKYEIWIRECAVCKHRFAELAPGSAHLNRVYSDEYFMGGTDGYPNYLNEKDILVKHGKRYGAILNRYTMPGKILDIGAAAGFILKGIQECGWQGIGLEPNPSMAEYGCSTLGLQIETGSLEQFNPKSQFDVISMIQVLPHFFDIRQALQIAADATRPGGYWIIETWDKDSWIARILKEGWHEYSPPSVLHWFSPIGLKRLAGQFGFSEIARGRPEKFISGAHVKSLLDYKLKASPLSWLSNGVNIIPDQLTIPYPAFDLFWILFQKTSNVQ